MERLKELRLRHKLKQSDLAEILNVDRTTIAKYEAGKHGPSSEVLFAMAEYFGGSTDYLLGFSDEETKKPTEQNLPDELTDPLDAEILSIFHSLTPEDREFFVEMMRRRGKI